MSGPRTERAVVVLTAGHYLACVVAAFLAGLLIGLLTFGPLS